MDEPSGNAQYNQSGGQRRQRPATGADNLSNYVFGKVQPQAIPLEEAVLGALMLDRDALPMVMDSLRPESFYLEAHQHIYRAIIRLFERSNPVDLLTVTEELRSGGELDKVGGPYYLVELSNRVASAANIEYHARIIAQKHIQRELISVSTKTIKNAYEDTTDVFDLLDDAEKGLFAITQNNLSRSYESMGTLSSKVLKMIEEVSKKTDGLTGVPTGFTDLDRLTSGWQPSDLIIVAARPGMGKTSFVLAVALNASRDFNKGVALFSLEMASTQLVQRLISMEAEISGSKMRNGKLEDYEWQQLQSTVEKLNTVPIYIDDTPAINIFELRAKCRRLKQQHDIQLVIIDYLQLMTGGGESTKNGNREQEISSISRALKSLAKELRVPVIALSQLSRAVETRGGSKRPQLSDLRECVTGDTLIALCDGTRRPIADCVGERLDVWTIDTQTQKIVPHQTDLIWEVGRKPVYKLTTQSGRSIRASAEHRLLTLEGWKIIGTMEPGQRIAVPRKSAAPAQVQQAERLHAFLSSKAGNTNVDTIPVEIFNDIKTRMKDQGISHRQMAEKRGTSYGGQAHFAFAPSRSVLAGYADLLDDKHLAQLAESDIFWDTIKTIEYAGEEPVYDLSVPDYHAWIANDIFSHNSGAIEQDADIVSFIYRPEYYQILEDENGQSLKGVAEYIIAKHRNGALDTVKLKFTDNFAKFGNLDDPTFAGLSDPLTGPFQPSVITRGSRMNDEDIPF
ncbi:MAG TPA: replicative DNA helicase, partial [Saprospiraceae bacterium]|nr:replicative DNA helicase [Saprospiraceae bacterium]